MNGRFALVLLGPAVVAGCSAFEPFATGPATPPAGTVEAGSRVAICYNTLATSLAEVNAQAQQQCTAKTEAKPVDTDWYLDNCPLLLPARATFVCTPEK